MIQFTASKTHPSKGALMAGLLAAILYSCVPAVSAAGYTVQSLNVPGAATRMSDNGAIAGTYVSKCTTFNYGPHEKGTYCYYAPWFYDGKGVTKLSNVWSNTRSTAADINDSLQLTGSDGSGAWLYAGGTVMRLTGGTPVAINNAGAAVGNAPNASFTYRAVRFTNGVGTEVLFNDPYLSSPTTSIWTADINDSGLITGWYKDAGNLYQSYVVDTNGSVTLIPNLGGTTAPVNCQPTRISEANPTTGETWIVGNCSGRAFMYELTSGTLTELANLPGASNLNVASVNSSGEAAGTSTLTGGVATAVMWPAGTTSGTIPTDLNANQAIVSGATINLRVIDIDTAGAILIDYLDSQYNRITDLLQPIP
ncbi:MAG: hypothetical protein ACR65R_12575 [Methylomicrobium sp.]